MRLTSRQLFPRFGSINALVFIAVFTIAVGAGADPFFKYLKGQRRNSFTEQEHRDYVRSHMEEYVDLILPDLRKLGSMILAKYPPDTHFFLDVGTGPAPVAAYLQTLDGVSRANVPLSGFRDWVDERGFFVMNPKPGQSNILSEEEYLKILREHFDRFIPREALRGDKTVVLIDTVQEGTTILNAHRRISDYIHSLNPNKKIEALGLLHPGVAPITKRPWSNIESESNVEQRLKSFRFIGLGNSELGRLLFNRVLQDFGEYTRFEPGREQSSDVKRTTLFEQMVSAMKSRKVRSCNDVIGSTTKQ